MKLITTLSKAKRYARIPDNFEPNDEDAEREDELILDMLESAQEQVVDICGLTEADLFDANGNYIHKVALRTAVLQLFAAQYSNREAMDATALVELPSYLQIISSLRKTVGIGSARIKGPTHVHR